MKIQFLNGGLANQVFQYIFVRFAELHHPGDEWHFDDSFFWVNQVHNGYELEKVFGLKPNLLSNYFDQDVWGEIISLKKKGSSVPQAFLDMGIPIKMIAETNNYKEFNPFDGDVTMIKASQFYPEITTIEHADIYYHGYWLNKNWLGSFRKEIMSELSFPVLQDEQNILYANMISNSKSVGIHIRRGDFVTLGWDIPIEIYKTACGQVLEAHPDSEFFVFSDDIEWCRQNAEKLGLNLASKTIYIAGNVNGKNYIDLQLLSMCRGMIMSNSSFCFLAALMNERLEFYINPTKREI